MATSTPRLMGAQVKRKEDSRLVTGTSTYVGDLNIPGLHYVAFVRSPHAHAKVGKIDASAAVRRPGVFKVVTGEDIRGRCKPIPLGGPSAEGGGGGETSIGRTHFPLSIGRVRYVGEPVAAVVATSEAAAVDAAAEVAVAREPISSPPWRRERPNSSMMPRRTSSTRRTSRRGTRTPPSRRRTEW